MISVQESPPPPPTVARAAADLVLALLRALVDRCITADYAETDGGIPVVTVKIGPVLGPVACVLHGLAREWLS